MSKKLWGGRFKKEIDKQFEEFSKSISYDYKLAEYDIFHSFIHVRALQKSGIISKKEAKQLVMALWEIKVAVSQKKFTPDLTAEDIHTDIQNRMAKKVGKLAAKLHTLRSRNDQIVFDEKWFCQAQAVVFKKLLYTVIASLEGFAGRNSGQFLVGYTHTQRAQVVLLGDYAGAFIQMFSRDSERLDNFLNSLWIYIGSGALAGSAISRESYDAALKEFLHELESKFKHTKTAIVKNSLDNVSDRDFIIEFLSIISITQMHLSRLAEDFILYSTREFSFLDLPEEFCTGSSLMPHKKNPDFLEIMRGSTGKIYGNLTAILTTMKGLPMTYNRDMQFDKEPLFSSVEILKEELAILARFIDALKIKKENINKALEDESIYATEIAEYLVMRGVAFSDAHELVGKIIRYAEDNKVKIKNMSDGVLKKFHPSLDIKKIKAIMTPEYAVSSKKSIARSAKKP